MTLLSAAGGEAAKQTDRPTDRLNLAIMSRERWDDGVSDLVEEQGKTRQDETIELCPGCTETSEIW